jgi:ABC-type nitrate/sulfonate/bicarbonate transport system substrate-binding protein
MRSERRNDAKKEGSNMRNIDKISFPYRAMTHLNLLHVVHGSGAWAKHGLDVNYDFQIKSAEAHRAIASGEIEFVGGNHISTYAHRARGDQWIYLGQTLNSVHPKLVVRPGSGINGIADLRGKRIGSLGHHPGLNDWLLLKQRGLDVDRDDFEFVTELKDVITPDRADQLAGEEAEKAKRLRRKPLWTWVRDGDVDAAFLLAPAHLFAESAALKVIDVEPLPMIWYTTISSGLPFVQKYPDIVERFLKGLIEGIHFFKTRSQESIKIIEQRYDKEGKLNHAQATYIYQELAPLLEPGLYPSMKAIANVYEEAKRDDADAEKINPMELWDMHHVRRIDDEGFISGLYGKQDPRTASNQRDPEYRREQEQKREAVITAVKACGHPVGQDCGCE